MANSEKGKKGFKSKEGGWKCPYCNGIFRTKRDEEFAPIKNKEGVDSPQTAKELYEKYWNLK